jgi:hypothetical protein
MFLKEVLPRILCDQKEFGSFDCESKKIVFMPNKVCSRVNPAHIFDLGKKIAKLEAEKKITFVRRMYSDRGVISEKNGDIVIFIYDLKQ